MANFSQRELTVAERQVKAQRKRDRKKFRKTCLKTGGSILGKALVSLAVMATTAGLKTGALKGYAKIKS